MKHGLIVLFFTCLITAFYNYVGQLVPQKEVYPPKVVEVRGDMTTEEMVEAGGLIFEGKGTCLNCHNGSARFPVLDDIGVRAGTQRDGMTEVEYLAESLYEPNTFIVKPFAPGMSPVNKPPIGLSDQEILTVIAYLQSLGGTPTVTMDTRLKYQGTADVPAVPAAPEGGKEELTGEQLVTNNGCLGCHSLTAPVPMVGPSLYDVGKRLTGPELYESLIDPEKVIAEGFAPGLMGPTLLGMGFYDKVTSKDLKKIVDYLMTLQGGE